MILQIKHSDFKKKKKKKLGRGKICINGGTSQQNIPIQCKSLPTKNLSSTEGDEPYWEPVRIHAYIIFNA